MCPNAQTTYIITVNLNVRKDIMIKDSQNVNETTTRTGNTIQKNSESVNSHVSSGHGASLIVRIVWYLAGVLLVLLGLRFILSLLGANTTNGFANFIYNTSHPFVAPFFSLFNYHEYIHGTSHLEVYTLIAMLVYALIAWGIAKLVSINQIQD